MSKIEHGSLSVKLQKVAGGLVLNVAVVSLQLPLCCWFHRDL